MAAGVLVSRRSPGRGGIEVRLDPVKASDPVSSPAQKAGQSLWSPLGPQQEIGRAIVTEFEDGSDQLGDGHLTLGKTLFEGRGIGNQIILAESHGSIGPFEPRLDAGLDLDRQQQLEGGAKGKALIGPVADPATSAGIQGTHPQTPCHEPFQVGKGQAGGLSRNRKGSRQAPRNQGTSCGITGGPACHAAFAPM